MLVEEQLNTDHQEHEDPQASEAVAAVELSIVMPCLNEAATIETCITKAQTALTTEGIAGEIIIADNGSTDGSREIARQAGARVIEVEHRGYGSALRAGIAASRGTYVIMGDSDDSYDFSEIGRFVEKLREGHQLVMGTRLKGKILPGAMPWLHRWIGNPVLTWLANLFFGTRLSDYHCGLRGFDRQAIDTLGLNTSGMEFASEMIAKAALHRLSMAEVPITYHPDGRTRPPHLRTWQDGWRHLQFLLLLSPNWVFLYPALLFIGLGVLGMVVLLPGPQTVGPVGLDVHTLLAAGIAIIIGSQILTLWLTANLFARSVGLLPASQFFADVSARFTLGSGLITGVLCGAVGLGLTLWALEMWANVQFDALDYQQALRRLIPGLVMLALGVQVLFASFIVSLLNFKATFR